MTAAVVLLPSLGRPASDFDHLAAELAAAGHRPWPLDPPATMAAGSTLHDLAAEVLARLDAAGLDRVHVIGHAFGQRLARCIVADAPERVASLTMLAAGGIVAMPDDAARSLLLCFDPTLPPAEHLEHVRHAFFAPGNDPSVWQDGWSATIAGYQGDATRATPPDDWRLAVAERVLVVQGLQDTVAVPENGRRHAAAHPGVVRLVELDGAGHALLPERPDEVAAAVLAFLADAPS